MSRADEVIADEIIERYGIPANRRAEVTALVGQVRTLAEQLAEAEESLDGVLADIQSLHEEVATFIRASRAEQALPTTSGPGGATNPIEGFGDIGAAIRGRGAQPIGR